MGRVLWVTALLSHLELHWQVGVRETPAKPFPLSWGHRFPSHLLAGLHTLHLDFQAPTTDLWFNKALKSIAGEVTNPSAEATAPSLLRGHQTHFEILCWCPETGTAINATWERVFTPLQWTALTLEAHGLSSAEKEWLVGARTHSSSA